jgi:hypothetical protein
MKRGILIFLALSAALTIAWPNGAKESAPKEEGGGRASKKSAPLVYSYQKDKPIYTVKVPPPAPIAPLPVAPHVAPALQVTANLNAPEASKRVKQTDFKESDPAFASYGCATMAVLGTVQTMTDTQFTKQEVDEIIKKNKDNDGFENTDYLVKWKETFTTALEGISNKSTCVGVIKLDSSGKEIYNYAPKDMTGVYAPLTGPVKGLSSGHYVEASLPNGNTVIYNPGNTDISKEDKEVIIPLLKASVQDFSYLKKSE